MTREEAEKYIKSKMCNDCSVHLGGGKCLDNCKVIEAIKALEQEPCGDAISRQWLIECVNEGWIKFDTEKDENRFIHLIRDIAPSVNPQTGHWLMTGEVDVFYDLPSYECSKCGQSSLENSDYCPNCGARMIEPQESEDKDDI